MLLNYLKIAWRNIRRNKVFALISIAGLALGSTTCLLAWLICSYEFSFDNFHLNRDRICRVTSRQYEGDKDLRAPNVRPQVPAILRRTLTGVDALTDVTPYWPRSTVRSPNNTQKQFEDGDIVITDPQYFAIFKYDWLAGNPSASMTAPFHVALTASRARQYFGPAPPEQWIGRTITYDDSITVTVSAIVRDWKDNTDFPFTEFISFSTFNNSPRRSNAFCFTLLSKGTPPARIDTLLKQLNLLDPRTGHKLDLRLEPLADIHFAPTTPGDNIRKASLPALYGMLGIAVFILLIAAINFINLSTAQSFRRAKEIGVRKVLGSSKTALVWQFLTETSLLVSLAVAIGLILVRPALYWFGDFIPEGMPFRFFSGHVLDFSLLLILIISLCAGFYPAVVLSSYQPVITLRGTGATNAHHGGFWRKGMIVFQFSISIMFIMATLVIGKQINFMLYSDPGFQSKAILTTRVPWRDSVSKVNLIKERFSRIPGVEAVIAQGAEPIGFASTYLDTLTYKGRAITKVYILPEAGNEEFQPFYQMRLVAGRNIIHSDSLSEFLINETASLRLGFSRPDQAPGKFVYWHGKAYPISGVVADFHEESYRQAILPLFVGHIPNYEKTLSIRVRPKNISATLSQLDKTWKTFYPDRPFEYEFIDEEIAAIYDNEKKTARLLTITTLTAIFISCMGLFGLALFVTRQRTKEMAIRKVLGAGVRQILALLAGDFLRPIALAFCIATPIAALFMYRWLEQFAYRTSINLLILLLAAVIVIVAVLATIGMQTLRSASANPVEGLREE